MEMADDKRFDLLRWPFERAVWAVEEWLVWPLRERVAEWSAPMRAAVGAVVLAVAVGAVALGISVVGSSDERVTATSLAPTPAKQVSGVGARESAGRPALQGAAIDFDPARAGSKSKTKEETADVGVGAAASEPVPSAAPAALAPPTVPAATKVARRFAGAFVLYETGRGGDEVRAIFRATATPQLARALLRRPPRLPADSKVPQAKVLNVVAGPARGSTLTLSASLLRVGVTSELRIDVQKTRDGPRVTSVLG
jgi:hypothetical protein